MIDDWTERRIGGPFSRIAPAFPAQLRWTPTMGAHLSFFVEIVATRVVRLTGEPENG
jgi:hypothetical protein